MTELLRVEKLSKDYLHKGRSWRVTRVNALSDISFTLEAGKTLAVMGVTGSGKSSLARIIAGAEAPTSGTLHLRNRLLQPGDHRFRSRSIRLIFQDTDASLNPHLTIGRQLEEPLLFNTDLNSTQRRYAVHDALGKVGLLPEHAVFHPHRLSTGQKQRACIARAIMLNPDIIVADEALAALDSSIRAQIINLLLDLQREMNISYIFVSHSPEIIRHVADEIIILRDGKMLVHDTASNLFANAADNDFDGLLQHSYTLT